MCTPLSELKKPERDANVGYAAHMRKAVRLSERSQAKNTTGRNEYGAAGHGPYLEGPLLAGCCLCSASNYTLHPAESHGQQRIPTAELP